MFRQGLQRVEGSEAPGSLAATPEAPLAHDTGERPLRATVNTDIPLRLDF